MNLQKQQLLLRLCRYFKSRKEEPRFFNKRTIFLMAAAGAYILTPDEFLLDGIGRLGLLTTRRSSWEPSSPSFFRIETNGPHPPQAGLAGRHFPELRGLPHECLRISQEKTFRFLPGKTAPA